MYKRVLLKISGEALMGNQGFGHDAGVVNRIAQEVKDVCDSNVQVCLVIGGGNIFRGISLATKGMDRSAADHVGMLATVMNALVMQNALEKIGVDTRILSAIPMTTICETYIRRRAIRHMEKNRVIIFAAGTGNPFFTTDTAAVLRAVETGCEALFKGTQVDGVYSDDPLKNANAKKYDKLNYKQVLNQDLSVMDTAAISLARENKLPLVVFSIHTHGGFLDVLQGKGSFSSISE